MTHGLSINYQGFSTDHDSNYHLGANLIHDNILQNRVSCINAGEPWSTTSLVGYHPIFIIPYYG